MNVIYPKIRTSRMLRYVFTLLMFSTICVNSYAQINLSADCTTGKADLSSITASNQPANTSLTWHSGTPATNANKLSSISSVVPGTYYAAFFDAINGCYSTNSMMVTVTTAICLENTCPATTVNLRSAISNPNLPPNTVLTWHTSLPVSDANKIADPSQISTSGTYYAAFYDAINMCYSGNGNAATEVIVNITPCAKLQLKVLLQGAMFGTSDGLMRDELRTKGVIPTAEPYTALANSRFTHVGGGGETTTSAVLTTSGNDAIVDWVFVELRDAANPSTVLKTKSALVQRDGDVVEANDGISPLTFVGVAGQSYYVAVKHRNHLGAMTATAIAMTTSGTLVDFTTMTASQVWNSSTTYDGFEQAVDDASGKMVLWAGNTTADIKVKYVGPSNDQTTIFGQVLNYLGNTSQSYNYDFATPVYLQGDVNMDGKVKYRGTNNDTNFIFYNIITKYILNTGDVYNYDLFFEQLP